MCSSDLCEIETDKATMEVEAVDEGTVAQILIAEGTEGVAVNTPILVLAADGESVADAAKSADAPKLTSGVYDWAQMTATPNAKGERRMVFDGPTGTVDKLHCHITTLKPGAVPGPGNTLQAPHLAVTIFMRGQLKHLFTRIYFADEAANADDPILALVDDKARRETLIAKKDGEGRYRWDVILQGKNETVFFDV